MPRIARRPEGDAPIMVAIDSGLFIEPDGTEHYVQIGDRLRATHPAVLLAPACFASSELDDVELRRARQELYEQRGIFGAG